MDTTQENLKRFIEMEEQQEEFLIVNVKTDPIQFYAGLTKPEMRLKITEDIDEAYLFPWKQYAQNVIDGDKRLRAFIIEPARNWVHLRKLNIESGKEI